MGKVLYNNNPKKQRTHMRRNKEYKKGYSIFGSDGSLHQIEYAQKSVSNSEPSIGIQCKNGIVLLSQNTSTKSSLLINESIEKIHKIDEKIGMAVSGHVTDGRILAEKLRKHTMDEKERYGHVSDTSTLVHNIAEDIQETIQSTELRPYGVSLLVAGIDYNDKPQLYKIDPSGATSAWKGTAIGKNHEKIIDYIEDEYNNDMKIDETVQLVVNSLLNNTKEDISAELLDIVTISTRNGYKKHTTDEIETIINKGEKE